MALKDFKNKKEIKESRERVRGERIAKKDINILPNPICLL